MCTLSKLLEEEVSKLSATEPVKAWAQLAEVLATAKKMEMALRKELVAVHFKNSRKGVNSISVDGGKLKFTKSFKTSIDESLFDSVARECDDSFIDLASVVKTTHSLDTKAYKALPDAERLIVDKMLVIKEQAPKLEFITDVAD